MPNLVFKLQHLYESHLDLMKRLLFSSLAGGLILFFWQFLSFAAVNLHRSAQQYTPHQDEILAKLAELDLEEGMYALGSPSPEEAADYNGPLGEQYINDHQGKPHAVLNYHHELDLTMTSNLIRSLVMNLLTAFALFWLLGQLPVTSCTGRIFASVCIGLIGFMFVPYSNFIWFKNPDIWAHLIDAIVPFSILGALSSFFHKRARLKSA